MKKMLFIFLCLSLFHSQRAHSQQVTAENVLKELTPETIQSVAQEIDTLSDEELADVLNKTLDQLKVKRKALRGAVQPGRSFDDLSPTTQKIVITIIITYFTVALTLVFWEKWCTKKA